MSATEAQSQVMRQTADKFNTVNEGLQRMLNQLLGELAGLQTAWQGRGGTTFAQVQAQWSADQSELTRRCRRPPTPSGRPAGQYATYRRQRRRTVSAAGHGRTLPL